MQFKEVIGQHKIKEQLIKTVSEQRVSHAQLFLGPTGAGKLPLAIAYAQYLNCINKQNGDSCGNCVSCKKYRKLTHPDLHFVFPVKKASETNPETSDDYLDKWRETLLENPYLSPQSWYKKLDLENKQGIIPTSESANIIRKLNYKSFEGEYKTMIIWLPERMHRSAANKLLKMIEEPPPNTIFLLVTENTDLILPTILSRTQKVEVSRIDEQSLFDAISDHFGMKAEKSKEIVHLANGSYIDALYYSKTSEEEKENFNRFVSLMRLTYSKNVTEILSWVDDTASIGRENVKLFLNYATRMIRENFMLNLNFEEIVYLTKDEKKFSKNFAKFINERNAKKIYNEFSKAYRDIEMNANAKVVFLDLSIKLMKLLRL